MANYLEVTLSDDQMAATVELLKRLDACKNDVTRTATLRVVWTDIPLPVVNAIVATRKALEDALAECNEVVAKRKARRQLLLVAGHP